MDIELNKTEIHPIIIIIIIIINDLAISSSARVRKVNFITVTGRPHHPNIAASLCCLATSPGFLPTLCENWSGIFYVHRVFLSYTRDRRLKVSSERLGNEDKAPCKGRYCRAGARTGDLWYEVRGSNRSAMTAPFEQDFMWKWMKIRQYILQDRGLIIEISG